ncbi:hypothetical protein [Rhodoblastus sp.]|uniref:hypothetical protein n=1 Tax=Rhodoblastus sp. TaxID=1962975 RepID=UPI002625AA74|nr:hypothetical protein [Rhodoblastus sp.]
MTGSSGSFAPRSAFESLLERIESRSGGEPRLTPALAEGRIHARLSVPPRQAFRALAAFAAYATLSEDSPRPPRAQPLPLEAHFARIREEVRAARDAEDLRRLRRTCALLVHPDRLPPAERAPAEGFMAEINAAIDRAIREKSAR